MVWCTLAVFSDISLEATLAGCSFFRVTRLIHIYLNSIPHGIKIFLVVGGGGGGGGEEASRPTPNNVHISKLSETKLVTYVKLQMLYPKM